MNREAQAASKSGPPILKGDVDKLISELEKKMREAAEDLEFEEAAKYRDRIKALTEVMLAC